ncbi:conserved protein of unknown function [Pseudorhizobium banfieldiae]|uniref:Uncharacterized protein n=1 Tax=Pseudorhizobium banfieldiae TaxID=1125847 RepID=L0NDB3_9HYPH|nr:hypothetical protein [Pseudorhizobium banfieldiae]CAD6605968.1 hypothetical protein RNT25_01756 [arsenite-oxidising bacterium NT-25]CCF19103.1 conserved protein of unknown function [Pseudorhizobium banfieldiae]
MMSRDHNEKTEQELYEDQQFMKGFADLKKLQSTMAGTKGDMGAIYKRLKDLGFSKKDVEFAFTLEDKDVGQVIADFENKIRIAKLFGHQLGRQMSLLDQDRTPQEDRAYEEGKAAGMLRKSGSNPYQPGSPEFQSWQKGMNDGHAFINKDLAAAVSPN